MLNFLIGLALCIWIAERIAHYSSEWRLRRHVRRHLESPSPPQEPTDRWVFPVLVCAALGVLAAAFTMH